MNTWLQRISAGSPLSYALYDEGYLTLGWHYLVQEGIADDAEIDSMIETGGNSQFLRRFVKEFAMNDIVVVPLMDKKFFSVARITGEAKPINELPAEVVNRVSNKGVFFDEKGFYREGEDGLKVYFDIGFFRTVSIEKEAMRRVDATPVLQRNLKARGTNCHAESEDVQKAIDFVEPIPFSDKLAEALRKKTIDTIFDELNDWQFEKLVAWLMEKVGASSARVLPKNERDKRDGADADVEAVFDDLRLRLLIQAKLYSGSTGDHAIDQIAKYMEQKRGSYDDGYGIQGWVISTGDFDDETIEEAVQRDVTLLDGSDFASMLLNHGFDGIDKAFD